MAQTLYCDGCTERPGVVMIQNLSTPEPLVFCPWCSIEFMEGFVAATKAELGLETSTDDDQAASAETSPGTDTPNAAVTSDDSGNEGTLPEASGDGAGTAEGGEDDGHLRNRGDRPAGGDSAGADGAGADQGAGDGPGDGDGDGPGRDESVDDGSAQHPVELASSSQQ